MVPVVQRLLGDQMGFSVDGAQAVPGWGSSWSLGCCCYCRAHCCCVQLALSGHRAGEEGQGQWHGAFSIGTAHLWE